MEITPTELQAIYVALSSAARAYSTGSNAPSASGPMLSQARQRHDAQFAFVCRQMADQIQRTQRVDLNEQTFPIVTAALRLSAQRWTDEAARELVAHEKKKKGAFALSYDALATRIEVAGGKATLEHTLKNNH